MNTIPAHRNFTAPYGETAFLIPHVNSFWLARDGRVMRVLAVDQEYHRVFLEVVNATGKMRRATHNHTIYFGLDRHTFFLTPTRAR